jgi:hypothetical protein
LDARAGEQSLPASSLDWLLTNFAERVPQIAHALAVSSDGLPLAASAGLPPERMEQLAAITSGLTSLTDGAARCLETGVVRQAVIDMSGGVLLVMSVTERAHLAVLAASGCDLGQVGYEAAVLVRRISSVLAPATR